jgi:hypothetical protein
VPPNQSRISCVVRRPRSRQITSIIPSGDGSQQARIVLLDQGFAIGFHGTMRQLEGERSSYHASFMRWLGRCPWWMTSGARLASWASNK